ncbi:hypothetical protein PLUTE_a1906 [Pseudoalteromonas luteoviolacea DSM 6061]|nr:hypothetical protein [Pseudoalteromonas luteoviolacea DSM 6061]
MRLHIKNTSNNTLIFYPLMKQKVLLTNSNQWFSKEWESIF